MGNAASDTLGDMNAETSPAHWSKVVGRWAGPALVATVAAAGVSLALQPTASDDYAAPAIAMPASGSANYQAAVDAAAESRPKVTLVATGGTIAGLASGRDTFASYRAGSIEGEELIAQLQPELAEVADVDVVQFGNAGSSGYTIDQFRQLTLVVEEALESSDGVVVTTGTDTQEEFAYWLDLTVQSQQPVVTTGAMRPWQDGEGELVFGADGPANLFNAVKLAASQATYCFGTVLMLNDEIHAARDVTKSNALRMDTFDSRSYGAIGYVDQNGITLGRGVPRVGDCDDPDEWMTPFDMSEVDEGGVARTEIVYSYQEAGGEPISAFHEAGVDGIVTAGTGAGGISAAMREARSAAADDGVMFVTTTRTGAGHIFGSTSGNIVPGGDLTPIKARLLLALSLTFTDDAEQVGSWFDEIGNQNVVATTSGDNPNKGPGNNSGNGNKNPGGKDSA